MKRTTNSSTQNRLGDITLCNIIYNGNIFITKLEHNMAQYSGVARVTSPIIIRGFSSIHLQKWFMFWHLMNDRAGAVRYHFVISKQLPVWVGATVDVVTTFPCVVIMTTNQRAELLHAVFNGSTRFLAWAYGGATNHEFTAPFQDTIHLMVSVVLQYNPIPITLLKPGCNSTGDRIFGSTRFWLHCHFVDRGTMCLTGE